MGFIDVDFNPLGPPFDLVEQDIVVVSSDPTTGSPGVLYMVSGDPTKVWYFIGGNRYYITGTESNPAGGDAFEFTDSTIFNFADNSEFDFIT